eukprot:999051-Amphidinium_carterae.1
MGPVDMWRTDLESSLGQATTPKLSQSGCLMCCQGRVTGEYVEPAASIEQTGRTGLRPTHSWRLQIVAQVGIVLA